MVNINLYLININVQSYMMTNQLMCFGGAKRNSRYGKRGMVRLLPNIRAKANPKLLESSNRFGKESFWSAFYAVGTK